MSMHFSNSFFFHGGKPVLFRGCFKNPLSQWHNLNMFVPQTCLLDHKNPDSNPPNLNKRSLTFSNQNQLYMNPRGVKKQKKTPKHQKWAPHRRDCHLPVDGLFRKEKYFKKCKDVLQASRRSAQSLHLPRVQNLIPKAREQKTGAFRSHLRLEVDLLLGNLLNLAKAGCCSAFPLLGCSSKDVLYLAVFFTRSKCGNT